MAKGERFSDHGPILRWFETQQEFVFPKNRFPSKMWFKVYDLYELIIDFCFSGKIKSVSDLETCNCGLFYTLILG